MAEVENKKPCRSFRIFEIRERLKEVRYELDWLEQKYTDNLGLMLEEDLWDAYDQGYQDGLMKEQRRLWNELTILEREEKRNGRAQDVCKNDN